MIGLVFSLPLEGATPCSPGNVQFRSRAGQYDTDGNNVLEETVE